MAVVINVNDLMSTRIGRGAQRHRRLCGALSTDNVNTITDVEFTEIVTERRRIVYTVHYVRVGVD